MTDQRILVGDCREQLANIETGTIDAIITDPPYELGFMGKSWDASGVAYDPATWAECLRVMKPGGHLCAFGGTRTYHRMTVAIEDAGLDHLQAVPKKQTSGEWAQNNFTSAPMQNVHPTVKPVALLRWLIRLMTPPGGTILDPFLGSGTAAVAATLEGRAWIGCELTHDYLPIIEGRVAWAEQQHDTATPTVPRHNTSTTTANPTLFGDPE